MNSKNTQNIKLKIIKFFFPFYPFNIFKTTQLLVLIAALLAINLILKRFTIPIVVFRTQLSFAWLPLYVTGWFFGPIFGLLFGVLTDSVGLLFSGSVWFWFYAIQEPLICFFAGLIGGWVSIAKNIKKIKTWIHVLIHQVFLLSFLILCLYIMLNWLNDLKSAPKWLSTSYFYIAITTIIIYTLIIEIILIVLIYKKYNNLILFLYATIIVATMIALWSFALGPYGVVSYYKYINNNSVPGPFIRYGAIYYLLPRIMREAIKTPIQSFLFTLLVLAMNPLIENIKSQFNQSYEYKRVLREKFSKKLKVNKL